MPPDILKFTHPSKRAKTPFAIFNTFFDAATLWARITLSFR